MSVVRIWSLHPRYLDRQGLTACWREALLAQAVLAGRTKGYTRHPQLERFRAAPAPLEAVGAYLLAVADEATARGYRFDLARVLRPQRARGRLTVTSGQLAHEWGHLASKLGQRSPDWLRALPPGDPEPHPLFRVVPGGVESWEVVADRPTASPAGALAQEQVEGDGQQD